MASTERHEAPAAGRPAPSTSQEVVLDQYFHADNLFALRSAVGAHASALGLAEPRVADLILVAHELAANAVRHGGANEEMPGRLRLWRDGHEVVCQVHDNGPGFGDADNAGRQAVPISANNGRGLWIIRQVVRQLNIATGPGGTTITVSLPLT
jgi:anti-sigma regulatory factor (Ser/Thr protein kinase)